MSQSSTSPLYLKRFMTPKSTSSLAFLLLALFLILCAFGFLNLFSSSPSTDVIEKQFLAFLIGIGMIVVIGWFVPLRLFEELTPFYLTGIFLLLLAVLLIGDVSGGARRWLLVGSFKIQPSELAKLAVAFSVARFFKTRSQIEVFGLFDLLPIAATVLAIFGLIFIQPDFGTAGICLLVAAFQLLLIPIKKTTLIIAGVGGVATAWLGWMFLLWPYQKLRIINLFDPAHDPSGSGYNSLQSLVAVGSGGAFGKGYMSGTQTHLRFLPEKHTDFAFSVFAEEHGFWICLLLFATFIFMAIVGLIIASRARDRFAQLLAVGIIANIFVQFSINAAMVLGAFPIVGLTMPFFSYGGSSMLASCIKVGILLAIERDSAGHFKRSYQLNS